MKTIYIHTIGGIPAYFSMRSGQIVYATRYGRDAEPAYSLKQIQKEQRITKKYRNKRGFYENDYGYRRYRV